jgi:hypothetical protein
MNYTLITNEIARIGHPRQYFYPAIYEIVFGSFPVSELRHFKTGKNGQRKIDLYLFCNFQGLAAAIFWLIINE